MSPDDRLHNDQALLRRIANGDTLAFRDLVGVYYPALLTFAWRLTGAQDIAEDVLQDVWMRVWRQRTTLSGEASLRAYLYVAVRRAARDRWRGKQREGAALEKTADLPEVVDTAPNALDTLVDDELASALQRAVQTLPSRCRETWALVREQGLSHSEAAQVMGVSINTVRAQMTRALTMLRRVAEGYLAVVVLTRF